MMIITAWSSQGLIAHYNPFNADSITIIDQNVGICDPFYRQSLKMTDNSEPLRILQWNSLGTHLLSISQSGSIEIFKQSVKGKGMFNRLLIIILFLWLL